MLYISSSPRVTSPNMEVCVDALYQKPNPRSEVILHIVAVFGGMIFMGMERPTLRLSQGPFYLGGAMLSIISILIAAFVVIPRVSWGWRFVWFAAVVGNILVMFRAALFS